MKLSSPAFKNNEEIPIQYTGDGQDLSPPLKWSGVPFGCKSFVLICEDPHPAQVSSRENLLDVNWMIYNIAPSTTFLPAGIDSKSEHQAPIRADQATNSFGISGYTGPLPPLGGGIHRYVFKLYALNAELNLQPDAEKTDLIHAMQGHILDACQLIGKYQRALELSTS